MASRRVFPPGRILRRVREISSVGHEAGTIDVRESSMRIAFDAYALFPFM